MLRWLDQRPPEAAVEAVVAWLDQCRQQGPPDDAVLIYPDDDLYYAIVPGAAVSGINVVIKYLVIADRERLLIVRDIT